MSPECNSEDPLPPSRKIFLKKKSQNKVSGLELFRQPHLADNFCPSSIRLTWAEDGGGEQIAVRQPRAC